MDIEYERPLRGKSLSMVQALLASAGLGWDDAVEITVNLTGGGGLLATGSRHKNVLKCIATAREYEGEGLITIIVSELVKDALADGISHLFVFTKPENTRVFEGLGFYRVAGTQSAVLLENRRDGASSYVSGLKAPEAKGVIAAIVANCNPFTNGHRYLIETAAKECDFLYLFILSEDASEFSAAARFRMAKECVADISNVAVCPTSDYLISYATFPDYFIKDKAQAKRINYELDIAVFAERFAKPLGISRRFAGTEPHCAVTAGYNAKMRELLPQAGIEFIELHRREQDGMAVSASTVRSLLSKGRLEEVRRLVPPPVYKYLLETQ